MDANFHYLLMSNQALVHKFLLEDLKDTELSIGQPKILDYLMEHDGNNQTQIARHCHIKGASLTTILHRMEEQDMVKRVVKKENRRNTYVYLTPHGKELARKVQNSFAKIERELFRGMDEKEVEIFMNVFRKINEKLTE